MGGWVGGWVEEEEAVQMSYCLWVLGGWVGGWVGGWFNYLYFLLLTVRTLRMTNFLVMVSPAKAGQW